LKSTVETLLPLCSLRAHLANTSRQPALGSPPNKPPSVYSKNRALVSTLPELDFFEVWSVRTHRDEPSCSNQRHLISLPTAQAGQDLLRSRRVITQRSAVMTRGMEPIMPTAGAPFSR